MPLYEYTCSSCGYQFEELVKKSDKSDVQKCTKCGKDAKVNMSSFSSVVSGSNKVPIDTLIGKEANRRWQIHHDRKSIRRENKDFRDVGIVKDPAPVMIMGNKDEKVKRKEYSTALSEHRQDRRKKGQEQFTESGSF